MKSKILKSGFAVAILAIALPTMAGEKNAVRVSEGFQHPESVVAHRKSLFVSNTGAELKPLEKDGDGYITKLSRKNGEIVEEKFITDLDSPKGMFAKGKRLYVADVNKVYVFNAKTKKKIAEHDLSNQGAAYLNDVTKAVNGVYVSSTLENTLYKIKRNGKVKEIKLKNANLNGINGVYRRPLGKVFVANFGHENEQNGNVGKFGVVRKKYKQIKKHGINDGIALKGGKVVYTDWVDKTKNAGNVITVKRIKGKTTKVDLPVAIGGPSSIYADRRHRILWVPSMTDNKIVAIPFSKL